MRRDNGRHAPEQNKKVKGPHTSDTEDDDGEDDDEYLYTTIDYTVAHEPLPVGTRMENIQNTSGDNVSTLWDEHKGMSVKCYFCTRPARSLLHVTKALEDRETIHQCYLIPGCQACNGSHRQLVLRKRCNAIKLVDYWMLEHAHTRQRVPHVSRRVTVRARRC